MHAHLEGLRDRAQLKRDAIRNFRPCGSKQPPISFNPAALVSPAPSYAKLTRPIKPFPPFPGADSDVSDEIGIGRIDSPESIMACPGFAVEPCEPFGKSYRHARSSTCWQKTQQDALAAEVTARLEQVAVEDETAGPADDPRVPPPDHIGRAPVRNSSWCLEMMVSMMERHVATHEDDDEAEMLAAEERGLPMAGGRSADAMDVMEILEAMAEEEEKAPHLSDSFALPPSVLPMLGVSRGRLPSVSECPMMLEAM